MSAPPAAKRARSHALDAAVSIVAAPGLGVPDDLLVLADGNLLSTLSVCLRPRGSASAVAGVAPDMVMLADTRAPAVRAHAPLAVTRVEAGAVLSADLLVVCWQIATRTAWHADGTKKHLRLRWPSAMNSPRILLRTLEQCPENSRR